MKLRSLLSVGIVLVIALAAVAGPSSGSAAAFERLKSLAGTWETKAPDGKVHVSTWKVISNGSAVMETMTSEDMVTMYHQDGERLMLTHYCGSKNQPRMRAEISPDGRTITFDFFDATNLPGPDAGHMHKMIMTIEDDNHLSQQWFFYKDGKQAMAETFHYARRK